MLTKSALTRKSLAIAALLAVILFLGAMCLAGPRGQTAAANVNPGTAEAEQGLAAGWTFEGRVYEGDVGVEPPGSQPLAGITVSVYGSNNPYPNTGTFIRSTTTNTEGWFGLTVYDDGHWEFYHIIETDPPGYNSVGAMSVGGAVRTNNWIEYVIPLQGKTLTGNKFWDRPATTLFEDDFEDGVADGWELQEGWSVVELGGEYVLSGSDHYRAVPVVDGWANYELTTRIKLDSGTVHVNLRLSQELVNTTDWVQKRYLLGLKENRVYIKKQVGSEFFDLYAADIPFSLGDWHTVRMRVEGTSIETYVDGVMAASLTDAIFVVDTENPLLFGKFAFETLAASLVFIGDVQVVGSPLPISPPGYTPTHTPTRTPTPTPTPTVPSGTAAPQPTCQELLVNGNFETGAFPPWISQEAVWLGPGWGGSGFGAHLGNANNATGRLWQEVTLPAGAGPMQLEFWWMVETASEQPNDRLEVWVRPLGSDADPLRTFQAMAPIGLWQRETLTVPVYDSPMLGLSLVETLEVAFRVRTDSSVPSLFRLDDVSLITCAGKRYIYLPLILRNYPVPAFTPTPTSTPTPIFADDFNNGALTGWTPNGGTWTNPGTCMRGEYATDTAWNMKTASGSNFVYEGTVNLLSGNAVGLTFRSSADGKSSYAAILDAPQGLFKIARYWPYQMLVSYAMTVERNHSYTIKVVANGNTIEAYLDGVKRLTVTDSTYSSGQFGVFLHRATATYDDLRAWALP